MMSAKLATPGLLKIQIFWKKDYDVIILDNGVTSKILSRDSNYIVDVVMWPKFANSSISIRESYTQFYKDLARKTTFFEGWPWFKFNDLGLALGMTLKFYTSVTKGLKLKVTKFYGLTPTFVEITWESLVGEPRPTSWIGLNLLIQKWKSANQHLNSFVMKVIMLMITTLPKH